MPLVILLGLFIVLTAAIAAFGYFTYARPARLVQQLNEGIEDPGVADPQQKPGFLSVLAFRVASLLPLSPADLRVARRDLAAAGIRSERAPAILQGTKLLLLPILTFGAFCLRSQIQNSVFKIVVIAIGALLGWFGPGLVLDRMIKRRQERIRFALPDALDLLVVCAEVGIGLDQAIQTVSRELVTAHPDLSDEFRLMGFEMLAGKSRSDALRHLALRTGEPELRKLVAILVQTDRFGTSVTEALRTQSDALRVRRRQDAEERAAKLGVKLIFPIFFFCLPSLVILVIGPGIIQLFKNLFPAMSSVH